MQPSGRPALRVPTTKLTPRMGRLLGQRMACRCRGGVGAPPGWGPGTVWQTLAISPLMLMQLVLPGANAPRAQGRSSIERPTGVRIIPAGVIELTKGGRLHRMDSSEVRVGAFLHGLWRANDNGRTWYPARVTKLVTVRDMSGAVSGAQVRHLKDDGADEEGTDANDTLDLQPEYMREYMRAYAAWPKSLCVGWVIAPVPLDQQNVRV